MGHAVHYLDAAGEAQIVDVPSLDAALQLVERLRNDDDASDVRVFREVPIEVRTYYRVVAVEEDGASGGPVDNGAADGAAAVEQPAATPATQRSAPASPPGEPVAEAAVPGEADAAEPSAAGGAAADESGAEAHRAADAWTSAAPPAPPSGATVVAPPPAPASESGDQQDAEAVEQSASGPKRALFNRG